MNRVTGPFCHAGSEHIGGGGDQPKGKMVLIERVKQTFHRLQWKLTLINLGITSIEGFSNVRLAQTAAFGMMGLIMFRGALHSS